MRDGSESGDFPPGMTRYVIGFLWKGPHHGEGSPAEQDEVQSLHLANTDRMRKLGALAVAGPFLDDGPLRGLYVFYETSVQRIRELAAEDPAISGGRLTLELHPWLGLEGLRTNDPA
ncbi:MAG: YciI family protein [Thermoplasmata archaeon]|nr:YciI family protein [Thermoplasmata archaeon]